MIYLATSKDIFRNILEAYGYEPINLLHFDTGDLVNFYDKIAEAHKNLSNDFDWLSVVDVNDELTENYVETLSAHMEKYGDCKIFLPITIKSIGGKYAGLINTCFWTPLFHDDNDEGRIGANSIKSATLIPQQLMHNFNYGGIAINSSILKFIEANPKRGFRYGLEYVLGAVHKGYEARVMGKIGYVKNISAESIEAIGTTQQKELVNFAKSLMGEIGEE
jgi:hypothetical protein